MILRSTPARWFELLTPRSEVTRALKTLADTGAVELQSHSVSTDAIADAGLQSILIGYRELARKYESYWPPAPPATPTMDPGKAEAALRELRAWAKEAQPLIVELEGVRRERVKLTSVYKLLETNPDALPNPALLGEAGPTLGCGLFLMPADAWPESVPASVILQRMVAGDEVYLLAVGPRGEFDAFQRVLASLKARGIEMPGNLPADTDETMTCIRERLERNREQETRVLGRLRELDTAHGTAAVVGMFELLDWMATHVPSFPSSENFAWITGWTSDADGSEITTALQRESVHYLMRLCEPPGEFDIPMLFRNPAWARPFEFFARQLGTPGGAETDPSSLVAIIAPLMFGFMFGDVGQGAVLLVAGLVLRRQIPPLGILVAGGISSMFFGLLFGSVFTLEQLIPALWLHPMEEPLTVLAASLVFGVVVLLLGLGLDAVQWRWIGQWSVWWRRRVGLVLAFLALLASFADIRFFYLALGGFGWFVLGEAFASAEARTPAALARAAGEFVESLFQLAVNTVSFVRIGAFALAHAGLGAAVLALADATASFTGTLMVLLLGNAVIIVLEGLVVAIQTTRLLLFEFFIRFLKATGRPFRPLPPPQVRTPINGSNA